jgi:hypothetical protein
MQAAYPTGWPADLISVKLGTAKPARFELALLESERLAGAQDDGHWLAARRLVNIDRQEAAAVEMGAEQRELLAAVNPALGVVDVEHDAPRHLFEAAAEHPNHRRRHALERGRAGHRCYGASGEDTAPSSLEANRRGAPCRSRMT